VLQDEECSSPINSVCWSRSGNKLLLSSADKSLSLWNVRSGNRIIRIVLEINPLQARLHPRFSKIPICLACPLSRPPVIVNLTTTQTTSLKVSVLERNERSTSVSHNRNADDGTTFCSPTPACFNKSGHLVYVGNSKGEILLVEHMNNEVLAMVPIPGGCEVKNIVFSRNGLYLLTSSSDRIIRIFKNLLPRIYDFMILEGHHVNPKFDGLYGVEKLKAIGSICLALIGELQDSSMIGQWKSPCFSGNGVAGGSASRGEHKIYIWNRVRLLKILEGPEESIVDFAWHPLNPIVVSVSYTGKLYIWGKVFTDKSSALVGQEVKPCEEEEVDIVTMKKDPDFSDSDMSQEELCFLPADPKFDAPERTDESVESSSRMIQ